jgi:hypothetical protein
LCFLRDAAENWGVHLDLIANQAPPTKATVSRALRNPDFLWVCAFSIVGLLMSLGMLIANPQMTELMALL